MLRALLYVSNWLRRGLDNQHIQAFESRDVEGLIFEGNQLWPVWLLYDVLCSYQAGTLTPESFPPDRALALVPPLLREKVLFYINQEPAPVKESALSLSPKAQAC